MTTTLDVSARISRLADLLAAQGHLADRQWRKRLHLVPRHHFVPDRAYAVPSSEDGPEEVAIDRRADPAAWWDAIYADMAIITQRDDGRADPASPQGLATCSSSAPGVVIPFLELLAPEPGHRVLEIGTGTGWTAGLLSAAVGEGNVTSIEIDAALAATARAGLAAAGQSPRIVHGDGSAGLPGGGLDRIHVTCGISAIPHTWIEQLQSGGVAVLPWMPDGWTGFKLRLVARGDGTAVGTFHGPASYMMLRSQRTGPVLWHAHHAGSADTSTTSLDPRDIISAGPAARLALTQVPGLVTTSSTDDDGSASLHLAEAGHPERSWAACDSGPGNQHTVTQYGARRLWDEAERCLRTWTAAGRPGPQDCTLLITPAGHQLRYGP